MSDVNELILKLLKEKAQANSSIAKQLMLSAYVEYDTTEIYLAVKNCYNFFIKDGRHDEAEELLYILEELEKFS